MKKLLVTLISICFLLPGICFSQIDRSASKVADRYLNGIKLIDLPEGKKMLYETEWEKPTYNNYPVFTEASTLFEGMFSTDIAGIQGYKRLIELKAVSKAGTPLMERYILISYKDQKSHNWKVFGFSTATDVEYWVQATAKRLGDTRILSDQLNYRLYGYHLLLAGRINQAEEAFQKASQLNKQNPDPRSQQSDFDVFLRIIRWMTVNRNSYLVNGIQSLKRENSRT
jgi:hypothetical protein